ncbi:MAG: hypothetical protein PWQ37_2013 [Candidatus Petromonas sp.]|nr:hypothetical protein [Candidatus Petromonas sp.]
MELSPKLYHWLVRPKWYTTRYMSNTLKSLLSDFDFNNKKVLDFGCGIGSNSLLFNPNCYIGIDCDSRRINYAKRLYTDYEFRHFLGNNFSFFDKSIDYILIMAVLHHISPVEISNYLQEFHRILKPNGKIIVIEPCLFEKSPLNNWWMTTFDKGKYICNEKTYVRMFEENSYKVENTKRFKKCFVYNELFFTASSQQ